jgi:branched-chain amino acid transport system substrate-binding protein
VEYEGDGVPDLLLVSDLPLSGRARERAAQVADAVRWQLEARAWHAGPWRVGFQSCDHADVTTGKWDPGRCAENGDGYAENPKVVGVVGPLDSGCAAVLIPVLNKAPGGGVPIVSPANTFTCLTRPAEGCVPGEPEKYYPAGRRNYARVIGNDLYQGAALAEQMRRDGVERLYVLRDGSGYGLAVATAAQRAAETLGIEVVGFDAWRPDEVSYEPVFREVGQSRADAVLLAGLLERGGAQVIKDKAAVLGPNEGSVRLYASDGFAARPLTRGATGRAAAGMRVVVAGVPTSALDGPARAFVRAFRKELSGGHAVDPYAVYGAEAARLLLDAVGRSNGTRRDVLRRLRTSRVEDGLLGSFGFDRYGDPAGAAGPVVGFTVYRAGSVLEPYAVVWPRPRAAAAALRP